MAVVVAVVVDKCSSGCYSEAFPFLAGSARESSGNCDSVNGCGVKIMNGALRSASLLYANVGGWFSLLTYILAW